MANTPRVRSALSDESSASRAQRTLARYFGPSRLKVDARDCEPYRRDASELEGELPAAVVLAESVADIQLALSDPAGRPLPPEGLRAVVLHEVGHALGLPHSDDGKDLMYPVTSRAVLTPRDSASMRLLYRLPVVSLR